ncbi:MAG: hypothetical protein H0X69_06620 [Gemmatimonadales bacterium]|nr:hypothetical protein [Gemmatimonadales bacterium]
MRHGPDLPIVVTVITVRVVQVIGDQIIHLVSLRHGLMPTPWTVPVLGPVPLAPVVGRTPGGIGRFDLEAVLVAHGGLCRATQGPEPVHRSDHRFPGAADSPPDASRTPCAAAP